MLERRAITEIPVYLRPYIVEQDASLYTPMDHASWRFILKVASSFFATHAHQKYLDGLRETGIGMERVPLIQEMDQKLRTFGWRAVAVSGFIPPAVFMEFLALGVLPIACDMRTLDHLAYTPAPDIVHEAAGHAPIIADPEYREYLGHYGEISQKAIYSDKDMDVYFAIRDLSEIKEDPGSTPEDIEKAQRRLDQAGAAVDYVSEATLLSRMGWWTFEYGLVGDLSAPKIYGAGLLSSIGESFHCLGPGVKKIPFSIQCVEMSYDITKPQPQLYVAPDFPSLTRALDELGDRMAFRIGGVEGLSRAKKAQTETTTVLDTGTQISGKLREWRTDSQENLSFLKYAGPVQISYKDHELEGQSAKYHRDGFSTPIGLLKNGKQCSELSLRAGEVTSLEFASGIVLQGKFVRELEKDGKKLVLSFDECRITQDQEDLFRPEWGTFDLVCGLKVVSVFGGPADRKRYLEDTGGFKQAPRKQKTNLVPSNRELNSLYARVRQLRESFSREASSELDQIVRELDEKYPSDWLLRYELLELNSAKRLGARWADLVASRLKGIARESEDKREIIERGLSLL